MLGHYVAIALRNLRRSPGAALNISRSRSASSRSSPRTPRRVPRPRRCAVPERDAPPHDDELQAEGGRVRRRSERRCRATAAYLRGLPAIESRALCVQFAIKTIASGERGAVRPSQRRPRFFEIFPLPFIAGSAASALGSPGSVPTGTRAEAVRGERNQSVSAWSCRTPSGHRDGRAGAAAQPVAHGPRTPSANLRFDALVSLDVREAVLAAVPGASPQSDRRELVQRQRDDVYPAARRGLSAKALVAARRLRAAHVRPTVCKPCGVLVGRSAVALATQGDMYGTGLSFGMLLVLGALVLVVACVNYANATARASHTREIGVRKARGHAEASAAQKPHRGRAVDRGCARACRGGVPARRAAPCLHRPPPTLFASWRVAVLGGDCRHRHGSQARIGVRVVARASGGRVATANVTLGSKLFSLVLVGTQFAIASLLLLVVTFASMQNRSSSGPVSALPGRCC